MWSRLAFRFARSRPGRRLVAFSFAKMDFLIPVKRLRDTANWLAFHHPSPAYPLHILIVPKREIAGIQEITPAEQELLVELFQIVQSLVAEFNLDATGYRLVTNGGKYQDIPLLHFHLISDLI